MSDIEKDNPDFDEMDDEPVVVMTDEDGNEYYYHEEIIIPIGAKRYAILVPLEDEEDCGCGCDCTDEDCAQNDDEADEMDVFIARIDTDEYGEEVYVDPTDDEFEQVRQAYEKLMSEEDDE